MSDNDLGWSLGFLGLALISRERRLAPYREAEHAAWWAGLTPAQQAAYNASLAQSQVRPAPRPKTVAEKKTRAKIWIFTLAVFVSLWPVSGALGEEGADTPGQPAWLLLIPVIFVVATLIYWFCEGSIESSARRRPSASGPSRSAQGYRSPFDRSGLS